MSQGLDGRSYVWATREEFRSAIYVDFRRDEGGNRSLKQKRAVSESIKGIKILYLRNAIRNDEMHDFVDQHDARDAKRDS